MPFSVFIDPLNRNSFRISRGRIVLSTGAQAARDRVYARLSTELGEWFLNVNDGVNYHGEDGILGGSRPAEEIAARFRMAVLSDPEVTRLDDFQIVEDVNNPRGYTVTMDIQVINSGVDGTSQPITLTV